MVSSNLSPPEAIQQRFSTSCQTNTPQRGAARYVVLQEADMTFITWLFALAFSAVLQLPPTATPQRFDYLVRADFFAGAAGDEASLAKVIALTERKLAENPRHAEAMVWHGATLLVRAGRAFQKGDFNTGGPLFQQGVKEMSDAVALAPDNPGVLIPRGAVLLEATRSMPPEAARPLIESAVNNYERALEIQMPTFNRLGDHAKGELLFGLAEGWSRLGEPDKTRRYFTRLISDAPTSGQAPRAQAWLATGTLPKSEGLSCVGCHK
jgi:tetratricopeptide (TPR) repeat protein